MGPAATLPNSRKSRAGLKYLVRPLAALVALVAFFLPALRLDTSGMPRPIWTTAPRPDAAWQNRTWSSAAMLPAGWAALRGRSSDFAAGMDNLDQGHTLAFASHQGVTRVSGIFRLGPYVPLALLAAAFFFGIAMLLTLLHRPDLATLASATALGCSLYAVVPLIWIAAEVRSQRALLFSYGTVVSIGLQLRAGLFLLPLALLALCLLPGAPAPEQ